MERRRVRAIVTWSFFMSAFFCHSAYARQSVQGSPAARIGGVASMPLHGPARNRIFLPTVEDGAWPEDPERLDLRIVFLPSNTRVLKRDIRSIRYSGPDKQALLIELSPLLDVPPGDDRLSVSVEGIDGEQANAETADARSTFVRVELANYDRQVRHSIAVEKSSEEKTFFSRLQLTAPLSGAGTLDINKTFKPGFLNQIVLEFSLGKGGNKKTDPRYLTAGLTFRKILLGSRRRRELDELRALRPLADRAQTMSNVERASTMLSAERKPQLFLNYAGLRFETDLKGLRPGPVNNLIYTGGLELRAPKKQIGSGPFYWSYRLTPASIEAGKNLRNKDDRAAQGYPIARLKAEAYLKLLYPSPCRYNTLFSGIVFEADFADRYLLKKESAFDRITNREDSSAKWNQYSLQMDLKVVSGLKLPEDLGRLIKPLSNLKIPKLGRHPALTFTYRRGGVPPVFAFNNTFKVGFSLESSDDDNASDLGSVIAHDKSP